MQRVDIFDESVSTLRKIVRLAWPVTLAMVLHTSLNIVDMIWVSRLGREAVAAVTLAGLIFWATFALAQVFGTGVQALVARAFGGREFNKASRSLRDGLLLSMGTGVFAAAAISLLARKLLLLLGAEIAVAERGVPYVLTMAVGTVFAMGSFTLVSALRATGDMMTPLKLNALSWIVNLVLDPLLIFGIGPFPQLGICGAGVATATAIFVALAGGLFLVQRPESPLHIRFGVATSAQALKDLFAVGLPGGFHYVLLSLGQMIMMRIVAGFGTAAVAAAGIGTRVTQISFVATMGLGTAVATMVGQYLGAGKLQSAERTVTMACRATFVLAAAISLAYAFFPTAFLTPFKVGPEVIAVGIVYFRISSLTLIFVMITITITRAFQGAGDTVWPTAVAALRLALFLALVALARWMTNLDPAMVWLVMGLSAVAQTLVVLWIFSLGTWKHRRLLSVERDVPEGEAVAES